MKYFNWKHLGALALMLGAMSLASACGDAEANPCRWNLDKVVLPEETQSVRAEAEESKVTLEFYEVGSDKAAFSRDYEVSATQQEILVSEVPADTEYTVKGAIYVDGAEEPALEFEAPCEVM